MTSQLQEPLLRRLLRAQAPQLADRPLRRVATGWDNEIWRLGDDLAVRLTRRPVAAALHLHEQTWLPVVAGGLPLPVPVPVVTGRAGPDFPLPWSVVPWFEGVVAAVTPPLPAEAPALGRFLAALHRPAPDAAPLNALRGVPLVVRRPTVEVVEEQARAGAARALVTAAVRVFDAGVRVPAALERVWLHGDLHARNVLVDRGRLVAVLDWGDMTAGDAATDLAAVWWLFDPTHHAAFWSAYPVVPTATWHRARAWAALFGLLFLTFTSPEDPDTPDPQAQALAQQLLERVIRPQRPPDRCRP